MILGIFTSRTSVVVVFPSVLLPLLNDLGKSLIEMNYFHPSGENSSETPSVRSCTRSICGMLV